MALVRRKVAWRLSTRHVEQLEMGQTCMNTSWCSCLCFSYHITCRQTCGAAILLLNITHRTLFGGEGQHASLCSQCRQRAHYAGVTLPTYHVARMSQAC